MELFLDFMEIFFQREETRVLEWKRGKKVQRYHPK
jgi:hypothetical protein